MLPAGHLLRANGISVDLTALGFVLMVSMVSAFGFALAPASQASRLNLDRALRDGGRTVATHPRAARRIHGLIAAEIALAFLLLFGAGLFVSSHARLHEVALGFDPQRVLTLRVSTGLPPQAPRADLRSYQDRILRILEAVPGSERAALANSLPIVGVAGTYLAPADRPRAPRGEELHSLVRAVSPAYFEVMGIRLLRGRTFTDADSDTSPRVAIVNQNLARRVFGSENPVGHRLEILSGGDPSVPSGTVEIVGLAPNTKELDLNEIEFNDLYSPLAQNPGRAFYVAVKSTDGSKASADALRHALQPVIPDGVVYDVASMEERIHSSLSGARFNVALVSFFAGLAVLLAAVGIYGAISFSAAQRTREIGLRLALGADRRAIVRLTLTRTGALALAGAGGGLALALILGSLVNTALYLVPGKHGGVLYGVGIHDPASLAAAAAGMLGLAALAGLAPALRAARVEPLAALRHDA